MNNAVYGKTCENMKKRTDIKLVTNDQKRRTLTNKPHCLNYRIFGENLAGIQLRKIKVEINKPFYVGFSVLELSKLLMYRFHYDYIKPKYGPDAELLFTDTDSLMYLIRTEDIYKDMWADRDRFDFAGYPKDSPYYNNDNNKVLGKMKDEAAGKPILEFIGLRPKMYSFVIALDRADPSKLKEKHVAKGIQRAVINTLRHEDYRRQLENPGPNQQLNRRIGANYHQLYSFETQKRGLSFADDKRWKVDRVYTLAYGHCKLREQMQHLQLDMHPSTEADAGLIVLSHEEYARSKLKRNQDSIMSSAKAILQDGAAAAVAADDPGFVSAWDLDADILDLETDQVHYYSAITFPPFLVNITRSLISLLTLFN